MDPVARLLLDYLRDVIFRSEQASLDLEQLPEGFRDFGTGLIYFAECVLQTKAFAQALSRGDLGSKLPPPGNEIAAPLKTLHATLKHLTWQTQQVASGDYQQRVDFMGDFSEAFNTMIERLDQQRAALLQEIESGRRKALAVEQSNSLLEAIAYIDMLTGVCNRHYGMQVLGEWLGDHKTFVICFLDIDNLKYVNDQYGHSEGDKYLQRVADVLRELSPEVIICRLGGDEFMLLAQQWTISAAKERLEALRNRLALHNDEPDALYIHSVSYGLIEVGTDTHVGR